MQLQQGFMTSEMGFSSQVALQKSPVADVAVGSQRVRADLFLSFRPRLYPMILRR
jgi:hypothetical protein